VANEQNLIPFNERTPEERREIAKKGAEATNKLKRERKTFKEALLLALETKKGDKTIQEIGIDSLMEKYMNGDLSTFIEIRNTIGEKPKEKIENLNIETRYEDYIDKVADEDEY